MFNVIVGWIIFTVTVLGGLAYFLFPFFIIGWLILEFKKDSENKKKKKPKEKKEKYEDGGFEV